MPCDLGGCRCWKQKIFRHIQTIREVLDDSAGWLTGTSGERLFQEALANSEAFRLENAVKLARKPLLCIGGSRIFTRRQRCTVTAHPHDPREGGHFAPNPYLSDRPLLCGLPAYGCQGCH